VDEFILTGDRQPVASASEHYSIISALLPLHTEEENFSF